MFKIIKLLKYYSGGKCVCTERLDGKVIVITGANSGIGKEAGFILSHKGAELILACRNIEEGNKVVKEIIKKSGNIYITCEQLDLADFESIVSFTNRIKNKGAQVYALINNAAIFHHPFQLTKNGFELTFQTNYLGPCLLTLLLLDSFKKKFPSRIVNVSSEAHRFPKCLEIQYLHLPKIKFDEFMVYGESKLCLHLFTNKLAKLVKGEEVTVNCVNPGNSRSNIYRSFPTINNVSLFSFHHFLLWLKFKNCWSGAQTVVHAVVDPNLKSTTGKYFSDCQESTASELANSEELADILWGCTLDWLKDYLSKSSFKKI
uniref:Uncharacterized protein n=1 Tax=Clastoptera arizonana TaxID=38151 RepID=A0A1B6ECP9_9HEMI